MCKTPALDPPQNRKHRWLLIGICCVLFLALLSIWIRHLTYTTYVPSLPDISLLEVREQFGDEVADQQISTNVNFPEHKLLLLHVNPWILASGPPAYVFDQQNRLVDWTPDSGDDSRFQDKWRNVFNARL